MPEKLACAILATAITRLGDSVRIDKQLVAFIGVKRATTKLDAKHLRQDEMYAVNEGVEWAILTNAGVLRYVAVRLTTSDLSDSARDGMAVEDVGVGTNMFTNGITKLRHPARRDRLRRARQYPLLPTRQSPAPASTLRATSVKATDITAAISRVRLKLRQCCEPTLETQTN